MLDIFQGSIGKAIYLKDKQEQYANLENIVTTLSRKDLIDIIQSAEILYKSKAEIFEMLDYINIILLKMAKREYQYTNCIKIVEDTKKRLNANSNYNMTIDNMIMTIWEEIH